LKPDPENYLGLTRKYANFWARKFPYAAEDIISVAYGALLVACEKWPGEGNLEGYIKRIVDNTINKFLMEDRLIAVSQYVIRQKLKESAENPDLPIIIHGSTRDLDTFVGTSQEDSSLHEIINDLNLTDLEKQILNLRLDNRNLKEIASIVGLKSHTTILYHLKKIQEKYTKWQNDNS
jgi:RNA polymerase sigma factor (sigma-70 family)